MDAASSLMYGHHWTGRPTLEGDLENFRNNGLSDGFDNTKKLHAHQPTIEVSEEMLHIILTMVMDMVGEAFFNAYYRSGVGNPEGPEVNGKTITISDLYAIFNAWQIVRHIPNAGRIVEIGPGYGALAALLRDIYPDTEIILVDLPEHRPVTEYYLENTVGMDGISISTDLPEGTDVVIALRCMMEMPMPEVERYIEWIQASASWFYLINRYMKRNVTKWYPFDDFWRPVVSRNDYISGVMHEFLLERTDQPDDTLRNQLETLPPFFSGESAAIWMTGKLVQQDGTFRNGH